MTSVRDPADSTPASSASPGASAPDTRLESPREPTAKGRRVVWIGALAIVALAVAFFAYRYVAARSDGPVYRVAAVGRGAVTAAVVASGTVNPVVTVLVGSQVSGQIRELHADYNTEVKKGQLVARIDPDLFETQVAQADADLSLANASVMTQQAALRRAQADLEAARANLSVAQAQTVKNRAALADAMRDYDRKRKLAESGAGSLAARDTAQATRDQARAQINSNEAQERGQAAAIRSAEMQIRNAEANVRMAEAQVLQKTAQLRQAQVNLDHTYIRAPVDGTVIQRNVDVGQTVAASLQAPTLFTIARDLRLMQVDSSIDEADMGSIKLGQKVLFTVDAYPGKPFEGEVVQIRKAPLVVQNVVTYNVVVSAPNPDGLLLPGFTANVKVITAHREDVLRVPNAALRFRPPGAAASAGAPGRATVHVVDESGTARPVAVQAGISDGEFTEIAGGEVRAGDQVAVGIVPPRKGARAVSPLMTMGPKL